MKTYLTYFNYDGMQAVNELITNCEDGVILNICRKQYIVLGLNKNKSILIENIKDINTEEFSFYAGATIVFPNDISFAIILKNDDTSIGRTIIEYLQQFIVNKGYETAIINNDLLIYHNNEMRKVASYAICPKSKTGMNAIFVHISMNTLTPLVEQICGQQYKRPGNLKRLIHTNTFEVLDFLSTKLQWLNDIDYKNMQASL